MKKLFILNLLIIVILSSCQKDDNPTFVFEQKDLVGKAFTDNELTVRFMDHDEVRFYMNRSPQNVATAKFLYVLDYIVIQDEHASEDATKLSETMPVLRKFLAKVQVDSPKKIELNTDYSVLFKGNEYKKNNVSFSPVQ